MTSRTDDELLRAFLAERDRDAFRLLVERYTPLVYARARRQVRDAHLAEDVTQAVFVLLARKARRVAGGAALAGWLVNATRLSAKAAVRADVRRRARELHAASTNHEAERTTMPGDAQAAQESVDEALCRLNERDRTAVTLHYLQGKSQRAVAESMGISEDAAAQRLSRAMAKLRGWFARRYGPAIAGVVVEEVLRREAAVACPPPAGLAHAAADAALLLVAVAGLANSAPVAVAAAVLSAMFWKAAALFLGTAIGAAAALLAAAAGVAAVRGHSWAGSVPGGPLRVGYYISAATAAPKPPEQNAWYQQFRIMEELGDARGVEFVPVIEAGSEGHPAQRRLLNYYFPGKMPVHVTDGAALRGFDVLLGAAVHDAPPAALDSIAGAVESGTGLVIRYCLGGCKAGLGGPAVTRLRGLREVRSGMQHGPAECVVVSGHPLLGTLAGDRDATLSIYPGGGFGHVPPERGELLVRMKSTDQLLDTGGGPMPGRESVPGNVVYVSTAGKGRVVGCNFPGNTPEPLQRATNNRFTLRTILWAANRPLD